MIRGKIFWYKWCFWSISRLPCKTIARFHDLSWVLRSTTLRRIQEHEEKLHTLKDRNEASSILIDEDRMKKSSSFMHYLWQGHILEDLHSSHGLGDQQIGYFWLLWDSFSSPGHVNESVTDRVIIRVWSSAIGILGWIVWEGWFWFIQDEFIHC